MNDSLYAAFRGRFENGSGAIDVRAIHLMGIAHPEAVIGGDMEYGVAAGHGFGQRCGLAQIANGGLSFETCEIFQIAGGADEQAQVCALVRQSAGHVRAKESGSACEENFQEQFSVLSFQSIIRDSD